VGGGRGAGGEAGEVAGGEVDHAAGEEEGRENDVQQEIVSTSSGDNKISMYRDEGGSCVLTVDAKPERKVGPWFEVEHLERNAYLQNRQEIVGKTKSDYRGCKCAHVDCGQKPLLAHDRDDQFSLNDWQPL
jgi:hypothetical protein